MSLNGPERNWKSWTGRALLGLGLLIFLGMRVWSSFQDDTTRRSIWIVYVCWTAVVLYYVGRALMRRARKESARTAGKIIEEDQRPPVLYLRSFSADRSSEALLRGGNRTAEEHLADVFREVGPFVAIGHPEEKLPSLGAARVYIDSNSQWWTEVADYMEKAALVLIRAGSSRGLAWEINYALARLPPEKIIFLIPGGGYDQLRSHLAPLLKGRCDLPEIRGLFQREGFPYWIRRVLYFEKDWSPRLTVVSPLGVERTLRPVLQRLGSGRCALDLDPGALGRDGSDLEANG